MSTDFVIAVLTQTEALRYPKNLRFRRYFRYLNFGVYLGVRTCEVFLCLVVIVRVRVYYVDLFVFFVLRHWRVSQVLTPRMSQILRSWN